MTYTEREQTQAKHFILKRYLQALAFKVLRGWDITYVDGFSGPWKSETDDHSDTSFKIALDVLKDAQQQIFGQTGKRRRIRCFFSEVDPAAFAQLEAAVSSYHNPSEGFEIRTFQGKFEDAVAEIQNFVGQSFPLIFIDPTGWTGYPFPRIKALFASAKCEVLINFMYGHISRFVASPDAATIASLDPILGGPGWRDRLDKSIPQGAAAEKLFRETLKAEGNFEYVVSTKIDKNTIDRPHFFIAYGTKSREGLKAFRQTEYDVLKFHAKNRANARERKREDKTGTVDLFSGVEAQVQEASFDDIVAEQMVSASQSVTALLSNTGSMKFEKLVDQLLQTFMLRETNVKDICVQLANSGVIENTWGGRSKPNDDTPIRRLRRNS